MWIYQTFFFEDILPVKRLAINPFRRPLKKPLSKEDLNPDMSKSTAVRSTRSKTAKSKSVRFKLPHETDQTDDGVGMIERGKLYIS